MKNARELWFSLARHIKHFERNVPPHPASPAQRQQVLQQRQQLKMAESAHAYVRGNTVRFYEWLRSDAVKAALPAGPDIWICGDCHTGNLGPVANITGEIEIQIRDLDQTVIGNPAHDLLRLGLSLAMAARGSDLPGVTTALMIEDMLAGYLATLTRPTASVDARDIAPIRRVMRESETRRWKHLAQERIEDPSPKIPLGKRFWPLATLEREQLDGLFFGETAARFVHIFDGTEKDDVRLLDAAYWMKGCSSLGLLRYAALVEIGTKKKTRQYRLLDIKEASHAAAPCSDRSDMPENNAERVVAGACHLSPFLGERMMPVTLSGKQVFIRELRPQDLKFEVENLDQSTAIAIARFLAGVVGRAHGRQLTRANRNAWAKELRRRNSKGLDAPRWLWSGVRDLVGLHEVAYLEHCRKYALGSAEV